MIEIAKRFGDNLVRCRKRVGVSQEELGFLASLHRTQIGSLERGGHCPRIDTLVKLIGALGVTADELLEGIVWRPGSARPGVFEAVDATSEEQMRPSQ